jgi:threonine/homoserine/homoserine lactone efflux protein
MVQLLGTFFIIGLTGALSPGPLTTMAIVEGSRRGRWSGIRLAIGHGLIEVVYVALIALVLWLGRDTLLEQPVIAGLIALLGGLFLAWMGWGMAWGAYRHELSLEGQAATKARFGLAPTGVLITLSNPYWWIWWIVVSPLYIQRSFTWGIAGLALLYFFHWTSDLGWLTGISWLTGSGRKLISPAAYRWVLIVCGAALVFFGLTFVAAGIGFWVTGNVSLG